MIIKFLQDKENIKNNDELSRLSLTYLTIKISKFQHILLREIDLNLMQDLYKIYKFFLKNDKIMFVIKSNKKDF